ncbi:MAG TPA: YihY/virulence factor BrkB family protein [Chloroflexota bacterium]
MIDEAKIFFEKFGRDWGPNLCALLAYNFLGAMFPLLLGILAIGALFLPLPVVHQIGTSLNGAMPAAVNGQNGLDLDFNMVLDKFKEGSGLAAIISFGTLLWTGSSLFGVMENCFGIIYRTKDRDFIRQKVMSLAMIAIFAVLAPLAFAASSVSGSYEQLSRSFSNVRGLALLFAAGSFVVGAAFAFLLFLSIYVIVPNLRLGWSHAWRGALVAGILFEVVSLAFPIYTTHFPGQSQFGGVAGLLAVLTLWFWIISFILVLGAEINSYFALGQRASRDNIAEVLHARKIHAEGRPGADASPPEAQERIMEDVQPADEKKRMQGSPVA